MILFVISFEKKDILVQRGIIHRILHNYRNTNTALSNLSPSSPLLSQQLINSLFFTSFPHKAILISVALLARLPLIHPSLSAKSQTHVSTLSLQWAELFCAVKCFYMFLYSMCHFFSLIISKFTPSFSDFIPSLFHTKLHPSGALLNCQVCAQRHW